jgi:hypothetical protein
MTNTYIQDKLDFEDFLMNRCPAHTNNSADGYERWLENMDIDLMIDYANEFKNDALTDYHNHIVEKVKEMKIAQNVRLNSVSRNDYKQASEYTGYNQAVCEILSLLQDTNKDNV